MNGVCQMSCRHRIFIGLRRTFGKSLKQGRPTAVITALFLILSLLLLATLSSLELAFYSRCYQLVSLLMNEKWFAK